MNVQPADPRSLLSDEGVAAQGMRGRVILAALERLRIEGVGGGDDQFFSVSRSGLSNAMAFLARAARCTAGMAR